MELGLKDIIYVLTIFGAAVGTFFSTKHGLKNYTRDRFDELNTRFSDHVLKVTEHISDLRLENERLKGKLELQDQIVQQFRREVLDHLPKLYQLVDKRKEE
ncbi:MAG: hypothetical protein AAGC88_08975 [Bacteroidota bacterium]